VVVDYVAGLEVILIYEVITSREEIFAYSQAIH
jgi:hypothetical protein